jgi:serine/threonine-protein kinase
MLTQALVINERVYGPVHPRVASTLNELGSIALAQGNLDDAESRYRRMLAIYREVYHNKHWLIGVATSNLGGVYTRRKDFVRAEQLFREALQAYAGTLPPTHQNVGITRIRLGDALLKQRRFAEAEQETVAGYGIVSKQAATSTRWLQPARENLALIYDNLGQPQKAQQFRAEFAAAEKKSTSAATAK